MAAELEPEADESALMTDDEFDQEVATAAAGGWEELGLDALPEGFVPASTEELRNVV